MEWFIWRCVSSIQVNLARWLWLTIFVSSIKISESNFEFLQQPVSQTVQEGGQVTFNCGVSTHRKISYQWQHNNRTIRTDRQPRFTIRSDGSLRITNADLDDSGIYQCTAVAKAKRSQAVRKKAKSRPATLVVEGMCDKAEIVTRPAHTTKFAIGTEFSLGCRCRSSSRGLVRWIKNGDTVSQVRGHLSLDNIWLNINGSSFADSGNYTCYVTIDKLGTAKSEKLEIWVGKKPQIIVPPPYRSSAVIGLEMHLHCLATGTPPPVVRWYYIGPVWSEHVKNSIHNGSAYRVHNNGTLVIGSITEKNVGFYECAASNVIGTATKKAGIYLPVKFLTKPQNTTVVIGKSAFLHCNATGSPEPVVSWRKEEGERDEKRFKQLKNGTLLIRDARMSDAGQYLCIAANQLDLKETKVTLRVVESEVIRLSPSHKYSIEAFLGGRRKITCEFHGRPPIKVRWYMVGKKPLPARIEQHGSSLIIQKVALSDAGQYFCHGYNVFSSLTAYVNVSVYDPLRFVQTPKNQTAFIGESVWFHCAATGSPKPKVTWLKHDQGGRPLDAEKYKVFKNGSLVIKNVGSGDSGRYFCIAATRVDLRQKTVHLVVKERPTQAQTGPIPVAASNSAPMSYSFVVTAAVVFLTVIIARGNFRW
ncbi:peroxidasin homolog [Acropora millepora]|uniref:peroxidasin homolog n=1 Tax=Acropora millepora TaxID=45264 RepID=UPI001CF30B98|nr:peroxidasin homolog [Acropora millepora]